MHQNRVRRAGSAGSIHPHFAPTNDGILAENRKYVIPRGFIQSGSRNSQVEIYHLPAFGMPGGFVGSREFHDLPTLKKDGALQRKSQAVERIARKRAQGVACGSMYNPLSKTPSSLKSISLSRRYPKLGVRDLKPVMYTSMPSAV